MKTTTVEMNADRVNALIASAYNLHIGTKVQGDFMTPAKAARLTKYDRATLCKLLQAKGGSCLFTQEQAAEALAIVINA